MTRKAAYSLLALMMSGCGLTETATLATMAVEGASFLRTGKTVSDHAVSYAMDGDCRLMEGVTRGRICREKSPKDSRTPSPAARARLAAALAPQTADKPAMSPVEPKAVDALGELESEPGPDPGKSWTLLIGTFDDLTAAERRVKLAEPEKATITSALDRGRVIFRVTVGAFARADANAVRAKFDWLGGETLSVLPVCPVWMRDGDCVVAGRAGSAAATPALRTGS